MFVETAWIMFDDEFITLKVLGDHEMEGLNMFGLFGIKDSPNVSIIEASSSGPMVWLLRSEFLKCELAHLI